MVDIELSLNDLYKKVGILVFSLLFLFIGLVLNSLQNEITKNIMYVLYILSYFGFIFLFGFFFDYFLKKSVESSKNFITKFVKKILDFHESKNNLSKSILYLISAIPIIGVIYYFKGISGLIDILLGPFSIFLLFSAYNQFKKHKEKITKE